MRQPRVFFCVSTLILKCCAPPGVVFPVKGGRFLCKGERFLHKGSRKGIKIKFTTPSNTQNRPLRITEPNLIECSLPYSCASGTRKPFLTIHTSSSHQQQQRWKWSYRSWSCYLRPRRFRLFIYLTTSYCRNGKIAIFFL